VSVTAQPPPSSPAPVEPPAVEIDDAEFQGFEIEDGVIEEARRRQRRRRTTGSALGVAAVAIAISALSIGGGGKGNSHAAAESLSESPLKLTLLHGRAFIGGQPALMGVALSLQAGNVGVCVRVVSSGSCNGPLPSATYPIYGDDGFSPEEKVGSAGEIDAIFTAPGVAAMRVAQLGTFKAEPAPGLPPGAKQIVFYRPPGSRGTVLPPGSDPQALQRFEHARQGPALTETLLDGAGRAIPIGRVPSTFMLPIGYWQGTQSPPSQGRCGLRTSLPGARTAWGQVATRITADPNITTPGWLTCLNSWFSLHGASYETAILLNAKAPGRPPAPLWGAIPVPGHPGVVQIPPVQQELHFRLPKLSPAQVARELAADAKRVGPAQAAEDVHPAEALSGEHSYLDVFVPPTVARRMGPAWVVVRGAGSLAQRIAFLEALHVTKLELC
jgi:hypothetical protein